MLALSFLPFPLLATDRLDLRPITAADAPALYALRSDPRVMRHIGRPRARSLEDASALIRDMDTAARTNVGIAWGLALRGAPELVGTVGFWRVEAEHHRTELGYLLQPALWGRGLAREAAEAVIAHGFGVFRFHRIEACVDPGNGPSIALLQRLGFAQEARFTQNFHFEGNFLDTLVFAQLRSAWEQRVRR